MHIHVRRIIHQFAKGTERADDGCRDDSSSKFCSPRQRGCWSRRLLFQESFSFFCFCKNTDFLGFVCLGLQNEKFSYAELFSLSFWERGVSPFAYWLGLTLKYFLKTSRKYFPSQKPSSFCYFSHGIFPSFQQLGSMFQTDIPYEISEVPGSVSAFSLL